MKPIIAFIALTASATASPLLDRRDDVLDNKDTLCKGRDLRTPEGVDALWDKTAAGVSLDLFIKTQWGKSLPSPL